MTTNPFRLGATSFGGFAAFGLSVLGITAFAQTEQGSSEAQSQFTVSAGARHDEDGSAAFTAATLEVNRATRTQRLNLTATSTYDFGLDGADDGFRDPRVSLSYSQQSGPLDVGFGLSYSRSDLDGRMAADATDPSIQTSDFVIDSGSRISRGGNVSLTYGARSPFGVSLALSASELDYLDVTDDRLVDSLTQEADLQLRFSVSPVLEVNAGLGVTHFEQQDAVESIDETLRASLGMTAQASRVLSVNGQVSWVETTTSELTQTGSRQSDTDRNVGFVLGATLQQRSGNIGLNYSRDIQTAGNIDRIRLSRRFDASKTAQFEASLGASRVNGEAANFDADIAWTQTLKTGTLQLTAAQTSRFDDQDEAVQTRQVAARYTMDLTPTSGLSADLSLSSISYDDETLNSESMRFGVGYSHQLTRDWDVSSQAYVSIVDDGTTEDDTYGLSLQLNRSFALFN